MPADSEVLRRPLLVEEYRKLSAVVTTELSLALLLMLLLGIVGATVEEGALSMLDAALSCTWSSEFLDRSDWERRAGESRVACESPSDTWAIKKWMDGLK